MTIDMTKKKSRTQRLAEHLIESGDLMTVAQIKKKFRIGQPSSAVRHLREQGNCIYTLQYPDGKIRYAAGNPTPEMVKFVALYADSDAFTVQMSRVAKD